MDILTSLIIGFLAGWLAGVVIKGEGYGIIADVILGIAGAFIGTWIMGFLGFPFKYGFLSSIAIATIGAVTLISLLRLLRKIS